MSSISVSSLVLGSLTVEVDGSDSTLALSVLGTAPASLTIELGTPGAQGDAATIAVGTTTTLSPGSSATVANVGTSSAAVFNFGIPQGLTGATGPGVPIGGTDGQVLSKIDATDYNTQWVTPFALQVRNQVRNETGAQLDKGTVVYINGAAGNKVTVTKALATGDATSAQTFAVLLENIPNNQNGYAVTSGLLENFDTSAFAAGTQVYLSPTVAGTFTATKPVAPDHMVYVGVIERSHANQGTMLVRIQNGYELEELHNVSAQTPSNNDLLAYETATSLWKNKTFSSLGLLTSATAASTYYLQTNPAGYIDATALAPYLTIASAAATYQTTAGMSAYLTTATASSTYLAKASNLSDLADTATARTNLGLGTAAVEPATKLVPAGGTTGQVLAKASNADWDDVWVTPSGGGGGATITSYLTPGTYSYTIPAGATRLKVFMWGAGGAGGSGARNVTTQPRSGGAGGGNAVFALFEFRTTDFTSPVTVVVAAGPAGGSAPTVSPSAGNAGTTTATLTSFGSYVTINGAPGAGGLTTGSTASGGAARSNIIMLNASIGSAGGSGNLTNGTSGGIANPFGMQSPTGGGGGAGAGINVLSTANGGNGGTKAQAAPNNTAGYNVNVIGGAGGQPGVGLLPTIGPSLGGYFGGSGGGGGGYRNGFAGQDGAKGGFPGGGGGGGGAADSGFLPGAGGAGGDGAVIVIAY